jgi:hypothetical protein
LQQMRMERPGPAPRRPPHPSIWRENPASWIQFIRPSNPPHNYSENFIVTAYAV